VTAVRELELDLDAFEGPFDLLLTLVLKEELEPAEVDIAAIVVAFVERLAEREQLDLEACGEFLVLIASLLELKARALFPDEEAELAELEPEEAAEELARRLAEYRRMKEAAGWLAERLAAERDRYFRVGPAPLAPEPERKLAPQDPERLAAALRALAEPPAQLSLSHMALRFPPVSQFLERFRAVLRRRRRFDFDAEVGELSRVDQAVAFLALLELRKAGEISLDQAAPFAPIRVSRSDARPWPATAPAGQSPAPPPPGAADGAPAGGPYHRTVPPAYAPSATPQERAGTEQESTHPSERGAEWIVRSA
jgi:segregation and condensation protein A